MRRILGVRVKHDISHVARGLLGPPIDHAEDVDCYALPIPESGWFAGRLAQSNSCKGLRFSRSLEGVPEEREHRK